jgi:hypothetical protein
MHWRTKLRRALACPLLCSFRPPWQTCYFAPNICSSLPIDGWAAEWLGQRGRLTERWHTREFSGEPQGPLVEGGWRLHPRNHRHRWDLAAVSRCRDGDNLVDATCPLLLQTPLKLYGIYGHVVFLLTFGFEGWARSRSSPSASAQYISASFRYWRLCLSDFAMSVRRANSRFPSLTWRCASLRRRRRA